MKALKNLKRPSRLSVFSGIAAVFLALAFEIGGAATPSFPLSDTGPISFIVGTALYTVLFFFLIRLLFKKLDKQPKTRKKPQFINKFSVKYFFIFFAIILACWMPVFLAFFPGGFGYDVEYQMTTPGIYDGHHPMIHNIFLRGSIYVGEKIFGRNNMAIAFHTILQMLMMSAIFAYICEVLRHFGKKRLHYLGAVFFGLMPFCSYMAISATKDAMYIALFAMSLALFYEALVIDKLSKKRIVLTAIIVALTALFRNNGPHILIIWLVVAGLMLWRNQAKRVLLYACAGGLVLAGLFHVVAINVFKSTGETEECAAFSIPLHLLDSVIVSHPEVLEEENLEDGKVFGYFDLDIAKEARYDSNLADLAKHSIGRQVTKGNKVQLLFTTLKVGLRYPITYAKSFITLMKSSFYPFAYDYYNVYGIKNPAGEDEAGLREGLTRPTVMTPYVSSQPLLPRLHNFLIREWFNLGYSRNLITNFIMAPATYVLMTFVLFLYGIYARRKHFVLLVCLPLIAYLVSLAGPCVLIRYLAPIMVTVPMLFVFLRLTPDKIVI